MYRLFFPLLLSSILYAHGRYFNERLVKKRVESYMRKHQIPGMAVGLYFDGKPFFYNFGYADPQKKTVVSKSTIFEIGSITKSFTATILALEVLKGHMNLDDRVGRYLPFVEKHDSPLKVVTLKQLATHTSSLARKSPVRKPLMTQRRVLHALLRWHPEFDIGSHYRYSNLGYTILGYALEQETGREYEQLFRDSIFKPLEMHQTMVRVPWKLLSKYAQGHNDKGIPVPRMGLPALGAAGALKSTIVDMMKFLKANLGECGPQSLKDAMHLTHKGFFKVTDSMIQGLSWQRVSSKDMLLIDKNGGVTGFSTWIGFVPDKKNGIVLLTNKRNKQLTGLGRRLLHDLNYR